MLWPGTEQDGESPTVVAARSEVRAGSEGPGNELICSGKVFQGRRGLSQRTGKLAEPGTVKNALQKKASAHVGHHGERTGQSCQGSAMLKLWSSCSLASVC